MKTFSNVSIQNVNDGATGSQGASVSSVVEEYCLSTSYSSLPSNPDWSTTEPTGVDADHYMWMRLKTTLSDGTVKYSSAVCQRTISGVISKADRNALSIQNKIWQSDIQSEIDSYDQDTVSTIRDQVSEINQDLTGITSRVGTVETTTSDLGPRMTSAESSITQNSKKIAAMVTVNGQSSSLTLTEKMIEAMTNQFIVKGADGTTTVISGGEIQANSIKTGDIATDAIKSTNYSAGTSGSPYSTFGTFLDLSNGNFYTQNFGVKNTGADAGAYINGEIIATAGRIGDDSSTAWDIGTFTDYEANDHGMIKANGDAFIQSGKWMISQDSINTQWYGNDLKLTHVYDNKGTTYYDYGMSVPKRNTTDDGYISSTVSENFLYIRKHANTIPTLETDWNYIFRVDKDGMIWINGKSIAQMISDGVDGGAYLPTSGGTVNGNVTITGTLTATASKANQLTHSISVNGKSFDGSSNVTVGTIGAAYGGTGQTSLINSANALLNALTTGSSTPVDSDYYISQYVAGGTTTTTYHRRPMSALWSYISGKLTANPTLLSDTYVLKSGDTITGSLTVENGILSDSAQFGDLIVTGAGRFTNGLYGNLIGNADTATKAAKVADSGNGTETTFAYSKAGLTTTSWLAAWNGYELRAISTATVRSVIGAQPAGSYVSKTGDTMTGDLILHSDSGNSPGLIFQRGNYTDNFNDWEIRDKGGYLYFGQRGSGSTAFDANVYLDNDGGVHATTFTGNLSGNATSATKFSSNRTISLSGDVTGSASSTGENGWSIATIVQDNSHNHYLNTILQGQSAVSANLDPLTQAMVGSASSNKSFGLPASGITIEYSTDGGETWQDYGANDAQKQNLFNETRITPFYLGKGTTKEFNNINNQLRVTIEPTDGRYTSFNGIYCWFSTQGSTCVMDLERSTIGAPDTFNTVFTGQTVSGWSGNNIRYFNSGTFGGGSTQTGNEYKYRITFRMTALYANSTSPNVCDIRFFGVNIWNGGSNTAVSNILARNRLYSWDGDFNAKFPAKVEATEFKGNATSATKLNSTRSFTIGKTAKNVDWSGAVSFSQAEISDNASTTAAGWMSKDDKVKLNGIETGAQVNTITGVKGNSESSYRTGNVNITAANIGLGNVTNNAQVKKIASSVSGNFVTWGGTDGATVADSGYSPAQAVKSLASDDDGNIVLEYLNGGYSDPIEITIIGHEGSSVSRADSLNVNGSAIGGADQPVYFTNQGKPTVANKIPKLNNATTGGVFYAPTAAGTSGQILQSSGGTPSWVNQSTLSVEKATKDSDGNQINTTYLKLSGGTLTGGLEINGHIAGDSSTTTGHGLYGGGGYHNAYNNIILHGDATTGSSGIAFVSDKGKGTNINAPSDRAFIQFHAMGVTTKTAEGTNPTLATTGEANKLVIGVGNDADDEIWLQAPSTAGIKHQLGATTYTIPSLVTTTTTANYPVITSAQAGLLNYNSSITMNGGTITATTFSGALSGNASSATEFSSAASVTLTGDTTGTASSKKGWSIATKTDRLSTVGDNRDVATTPNNYSNKIIFQGLKTNGNINSPSTDSYSYLVGLRGWSDSSGGNSHELAFNNHGIFRRDGATTDWGNWYKMLDSGNYTDYTVAKTGTGASGTWNISITGAAAKDGDGNTISSTYAKLSGATFTGAVNFANNTLNLIGDDAYLGDQNVAGCIAIKGKNGATGIQFVPYSGSTSQKISIDGAGNMTITGNIVNDGTGTLGSTSNPFHQLVLGGTTNDTTTAGSMNPRITFQEGTSGTQPVHLIYSDYDSYRSPAGLKIVGDSTASSSPAWLEVEGTVYASAFNGNASSATKATQDGSGNVITSTYAKLASPTFTGLVNSPYYLATQKMTISSGIVGELTTRPRSGLFADGIAITNPATRYDVGWIRMLGTGESDTVMEIATGDDAGAGEQIIVRQYNTSNAVAKELKLLDNSGNTSVPGTFTVGDYVTLSYSSSTQSLDFIFN